MTDEEIKALEKEPAVEVVEKKEPDKSAADEAAEKLQQQLASAQAAEKAARETAEAERRERVAAEQRARDREQEATQYRGQVQSEQLNTIATAMEAATRETDMATVEYKRAMEAGEWDKAAEAQKAIALASARLVQLEHIKASVPPQGQRIEGRVEQPQVQQDPTEQFISAFPPASQAWLRQHRDLVVKDGRGMPRLHSRVLAAHYASEDDGIRPDTPEYFSYIEGKLNPPKQVDDPPPKQRQAPVAAPVSRDGSSNGRQRITLTKEQVEAAHLYGDPKKTEREREIDYWNNLKALEADGKIGRYQH
ncbi:MAG TPA: hypothetical protein VFA65_24180 [Bryobacteraceae bacterium]|nr:hypothetical protein [Bryobacteraceae bacterium]